MTQKYQNGQALDYGRATRSQLVAEIEYWKERSAELASQLYLYEGWISNPDLQASLAKILIGTHLAMAKSRESNGETRGNKIRVYRSDVARLGGCSVSTISDGWKKLSASGLIEREIVGSKIDGNLDKACFVSISKEMLVNPGKITVTGGKLGGKRIPICKDCGSQQLIKETRYTCFQCGGVMKEDEVIMVAEEDVAPLPEHVENSIVLEDGTELF